MSQLDIRPRGLLVQPQNQIIQGSERGDVKHSAVGAVLRKTRTTCNQTSFFYFKKLLSGYSVVAIKS